MPGMFSLADPQLLLLLEGSMAWLVQEMVLLQVPKRVEKVALLQRP